MRTARILATNSSDLNYNLALEQVLLQTLTPADNCLIIRFWYNLPSVIVGRSQRIEEEVDLEYCKANNIPIGRRISGGGTVFQDSGSLNVSFFVLKNWLPLSKHAKVPEVTEFFTDILTKTLNETGYQNLEKMGSTNILYKGRKISGSAGYFSKGKVLHHATLLHSVNLKNLEAVCDPAKYGPKHKRRSNYFPTANLPNFNLSKWQSTLYAGLRDIFQCELKTVFLKPEEDEIARELSDKMYSKQTWIFDGIRGH
ncbi:MAG: biotin/lipoate A/B protein ligase family protein [Candidatus Heimdallarchaeota archaeon]